MNKEKFCELFVLHESDLIGRLVKRGCEKQDAEEIVYESLVKILEATQFKSYRTHKHALSSLVHTVNNSHKDFLKAARQNVGRWNDEGETAVVPVREEVPDVFEDKPCSFCHVGVLNHYQACPRCRTILGTEKGPRRVRVTLSEIQMADFPDVALTTDVNRAIDRLNPHEQAVIRHVMQGNESLGTLAEMTGLSKTGLWRVYVGAKYKLADYLLDYAGMHKRAT